MKPAGGIVNKGWTEGQVGAEIQSLLCPPSGGSCACSEKRSLFLRHAIWASYDPSRGPAFGDSQGEAVQAIGSPELIFSSKRARGEE